MRGRAGGRLAVAGHLSRLGPAFPGLSTDTFESLGIPVPENYSAPSYGALEDTLGVHMQALKMGDILFTICSCEQWVEQSYNIKTRTDTKPDNEWLGYDPTSPNADQTEKCVRKNAATWTCSVGDYPLRAPQVKDLPDGLIQHMRAEINNDAKGWDDPNCNGARLRLPGRVRADGPVEDPRQLHARRHRRERQGGLQAHLHDRDGQRLQRLHRVVPRVHGPRPLPQGADRVGPALERLLRDPPGADGPCAERRHRLPATAIDGQTDPSTADPAWAHMVVKEAADQQLEDARVKAVGEAAAAGVQAYALTLPNDGGEDQALVQPKDIERFDAATFTWDGGNNYSDNPTVTVEREVPPGRWETFADQSGEIPVTLAYPDSTPDGIVTYRTTPKEWKWTASFEAFVSRFPLIDPQGHRYSATPAGTYRFVVHGQWRKGNADTPYTRISRTFAVKPWSGITVENVGTDSKGHVTFNAGPPHEIKETTVRNTARPPLAATNAPIPFKIGPVDFPDTAKDTKATGARFLSATRGYSGASLTELEHYCLDCSFRPWLDATDALTATVKIGNTTETVKPDADGHFKTDAVLKPGQSATITIKDAWGDDGTGGV